MNDKSTPIFRFNCLRVLFRRTFDLYSRDVRQGRNENPFADEAPEYDVEGSCYRLGIVAEPFHHHWPYIAACRELGVSYRLLDLRDDDWKEQITVSGCDAFLVWPCMGRKHLRETFDARLFSLESELGKRVYPAYHETVLYENKLRLAAWLREKNIPHAETHVWTNQEEAHAFAERAHFPVVVKTSLGAMGSGVWIVQNRKEYLRKIRQAFGKGLLADYRHRSERERGTLLTQTFLPNVNEWRMVRVGDSYFGHQKGKRGEFHSGSGLVDWAPPEKRHLDFLHAVTEAGRFRSMAVDLFETPGGDLLVNELQTVFSARTSVDQCRVDGKPGRFVRDSATGAWAFQPGDFARNACCNLRVEDLLKLLA
ncbi:MAG: hypothetical protein PF795_07975 [Kiritimatiellae bacterium]|jgi:hypothetical protein|nr:hypothetical protein [Kiritimatiellia bacterium]